MIELLTVASIVESIDLFMRDFVCFEFFLVVKWVVRSVLCASDICVTP